MTPQARAEKLIDVYLSWLVSTDADAGWHQPSMLQRMIEFKGDIPPPTGFDQADLKMIQEITFLRTDHALLSEAKQRILMVPMKFRLPMLYWRKYEGTCDAGGKRLTERKIAGHLGLSVRQYRYRKVRGLGFVMGEIELAEAV